jgi:hypothetical protein
VPHACWYYNRLCNFNEKHLCGAMETVLRPGLCSDGGWPWVRAQGRAQYATCEGADRGHEVKDTEELVYKWSLSSAWGGG